MFAIRARRKTVTEKDFLDAVNKVAVLAQFSSTVAECILCHSKRMALCRGRLSYIPTFALCAQVIKGYQKFSATPKYMVYN